ncbi:MAG: hypothetical protein ABFD10_22520 [Prolixibacteraceae bacterium]
MNIHSFIKPLTLIVLISSNVSCVNQSQEKKAIESLVQNCLGRKLLLPDSLVVYSPFNQYFMDSLEITRAYLKVYSYINASCPTCIEDISSWNEITPLFNKNNVPVVLVCGSKDNFELIKYFHETGVINEFSFPLFFDINQQYLVKNNFMKESQHLQTVLVDGENNILLLGNPIHSMRIKKLYSKEIKKRIQVHQ